MATAKNAARNLLCFFCFTVIHSFRLTVFDPLAWSDLPPRHLLLCVYSIAYHPHYTPPPPLICKSSAKNRIYSQNASGFFGDLAVFTAAPSVPDGQVPFCKKSPSVFSDRGAFPHFPSIERGTFLLTEQRPQPSAHPRGRCSPTSRPGPRGPCGRRRPACGRWACAGQDHG